MEEEEEGEGQGRLPAALALGPKGGEVRTAPQRVAAAVPPPAKEGEPQFWR